MCSLIQVGCHCIVVDISTLLASGLSVVYVWRPLPNGVLGCSLQHMTVQGPSRNLKGAPQHLCLVWYGASHAAQVPIVLQLTY
jgi:hypothetical protein